MLLLDSVEFGCVNVCHIQYVIFCRCKPKKGEVEGGGGGGGDCGASIQTIA